MGVVGGSLSCLASRTTGSRDRCSERRASHRRSTKRNRGPGRPQIRVVLRRAVVTMSAAGCCACGRRQLGMRNASLRHSPQFVSARRPGFGKDAGMSDLGRRDVERDRAMAHHGHQVAKGLRQNRPGDADGGTGWRGALQVAADQSRQDREILRLADELYSAAPDLTTPAGVRTYASRPCRRSRVLRLRGSCAACSTGRSPTPATTPTRRPERVDLRFSASRSPCPRGRDLPGGRGSGRDGAPATGRGAVRSS